MKKIYFLALAFSLTIPAFNASACGNSIISSTNSNNSDSSEATSQDETTASIGHNVGVYYYNAATGIATLVESYYSPNASSWAYNEGYVIQSNASFSGSNGTSAEDSISCDNGSTPPTLPTVTATALVPRGIFFGGGYFLRLLGIGGGGSGSGVNTVRVGAEVYIENVGCYQSTAERWTHANVTAANYLGSVRSGDDFIVIMPGGQREHWTFRCVSAYLCNPGMSHIVDATPRVNACGN